MVARRKLPTVTPNPLSLRWNAYSDAAREAIEKDRGLIEAALVADCIIITLDDRLQDALKERPDGQDLLRKIQWINPRTNGVAAIEML